MRIAPACVLVWGTFCLGIAAHAAEVEPRAAAPEIQGAPVEKAKRLPWIGATLDVGVPDGAGVSLVLRPWYFVRLHAGATYNVLSPGIRGGLTLIPFRFPITPTLTAEVGHYFPGDASAMLQGALGQDTPALKNVSYDFANAHLGLELGSPKRFVFFLRGGVSYVQLSLPDVGEAVSQQAKGALSLESPNVRFTIPSAKLGFVLYLG